MQNDVSALLCFLSPLPLYLSLSLIGCHTVNQALHISRIQEEKTFHGDNVSATC